MIRKRDASLQFQLSAKMVQQRQYLEILSDFSPDSSMLQSVAIRLQISGTVFKNQLSVTGTLFSRGKTSILLHTAICVALHMAEYA